MLDPMPGESLLGGARVPGSIKERPEDFRVVEIPLYPPSGSGEHLYLKICKRGLSHGEAIHAIARYFGVSQQRVGFAGMKDKAACTIQAITVQTPASYDPSRPIHPRIDVLDATRHQNKLRRGHLSGNRFTILIRRTDPSMVDVVAAGLSRLEARGAPNYFGAQRFGYRRANHVVGTCLMRRDWMGALDALLGPLRGFPDPVAGEARTLYAERRYADALREWRHGYQAERLALARLARGEDARRAVLSIGRAAIGFYVSAAQSAVFNVVLDQRIRDGLLSSLRVGDLAWRHVSRRVFRVYSEDACDENTLAELERLELSPSGPMWGADMMRAQDETDAAELAGLEAIGLAPDDLHDPPCQVRGARRPLRVVLSQASASIGTDSHGPFICVEFSLERGAYATVVLCELLRSEQSSNQQSLGEESDD